VTVEFTKPHLEYGDLWPLLVVFGVACVGLLVEAFVPRPRRYLTQVALTLAGLLVALGGSIGVGVGLDDLKGARGLVAGEGALAIDGPSVYLWGLVLLCAVGGVLLFAERRLEGGVTVFAGQAAALPGTAAEREASTRGLEHTEVYPLLMFAVGGMMLFPAANDLLMLFVALEVLSLPLYLLCGLARRRRLLSQEAALKYFLLGAFSSGFFLYGLALVYGYAGSMEFAGIAAAVQGDAADHSLLLIGIGLMSVGLFFKVGAVPFHTWTPDVYQGAPTAVTAFMSAATKIAAFGAFLRLFYVAFGADRWSWQPMLWVVAILTMVAGAVLAVVQTDVKRMLAYSSIAHTGFLLTGLLGVQAAGDLGKGEITSLEAVLFYLTTYGVAIVGSFALVTVVRDAGGETGRFAAWTGLGRRAPLTAGVFAFFLLSMAGIPLTAGFIGKWAVFSVALSAGAWPVVVVAIGSSIIAVFFYVRFILLMFFTAPAEGAAAAAVTTASPLTTGVIAVTAAATLVLGVVPGPVLDLVGHAGSFIR
jgi:NADH-quinone oxidoreductase subunit N